MARRYEVTSAEWKRIKDILPPERSGTKGQPQIDNRNMLNGMLWILRSGCEWSDMPKRYGDWQIVYSRYREWQEDGIIEQVFSKLDKEPEPNYESIFSALVQSLESVDDGEKEEQ
ncbi:MAG: transposase [Candidatus Fimadaptatus sp.]